MKFKNYHVILMSLGGVMLVYGIWAAVQPYNFQLNVIKDKLIWSPILGLTVSYMVCLLFQRSDNEITKKGYMTAIISAAIMAPVILILVGPAIHDIIQQNNNIQGFKWLEGIADKI